MGKSESAHLAGTLGEVLAEARKYADKKEIRLGELVEEALRVYLARRRGK